jgi:cytochrome c biogenesis protein CcdA
MPIFSSAILVAIIPRNPALTTVNLLFFTLGAILPFLASSLAVMIAKNVLRNQYQAIAKWVKPLSSSILILTGLLLFLPIFGFPSIFY